MKARKKQAKPNSSRNSYRKIGEHMKLVINRCYGGFGLSIDAQNLYASKAGFELFHYVQTKYKHSDGVEMYKRLEPEDDFHLFVSSYKSDQGDSFESPSYDDYWSYYDLDRNDPNLIAVVEELGKKANGDFAKLEVVEIPDGIDWELDAYDGIETVHEKHRSWP